MGLPVHSRCSPQCVCASVRLALSQILAIPTRIAHVVATIAAILPQVARLVPRRGGIAVLQVLPYLPAVLADVLGVAAAVPAVAAPLTARAAGRASGGVSPSSELLPGALPAGHEPTH